MKLYNYNPQSLEFTGVTFAEKDPLEKDRFLIPANCTTTEPNHTVNDGEVSVFIDGEWVVKPDFRGSDYWNSAGDKHTVTEIGALPEGVALSPQPTKFHTLESGEWIYDENLHRSEWRKTAFMTRAEFAVIAAGAGWVTEAEAKAWVASQAVPDVAMQVINGLPQGERFKAEIAALAQEPVSRNAQLILGMMAVMNVTPEQMDQLYGFKSLE